MSFYMPRRQTGMGMYMVLAFSASIIRLLRCGECSVPTAWWIHLHVHVAMSLRTHTGMVVVLIVNTMDDWSSWGTLHHESFLTLDSLASEGSHSWCFATRCQHILRVQDLCGPVVPCSLQCNLKLPWQVSMKLLTQIFANQASAWV